jgi:hypothetical protein
MRIARRSLVAASFLVAVLAACSEDSPAGPDPALIGVWNATSILVPGTDLIADGMTLTATVNNDGTYELDITGDLMGACDPGPDCVVTGDYSATATQITFDPGSVDETTLNYSISGNNLTLGGNIGGIPVTFAFTRV